MKKIIQFNLLTKLFLGVFALLALNGCEKDDDGGFVPAVFLDIEGQSVSNLGGDYEFEMLSNLPWEVTSDVDWINFTEVSGDKGKSKIKYSVVPNKDDERTGTIFISTLESTQKEVLVTQEAGNRDDIYVKVGGTGEGFTWAEATNLDVAFAMAVTGNTIHIAEGIYTPGMTVTGGDTSDDRDKTFEVRNNITLLGGYPADAVEGAEPRPSENLTVLSGGGTSYHVVTVSAPKTDEQKVVLSGLTITEGRAGSDATSAKMNGIDFRRDYGGGVTIGNAIVEILDSEIINNASEKNVAGLYAFEGSEVTLRRTKVNNNISAGNAGGIWISASTAYISDSEFNNNEGGTAAGVHGYPDSKIYMTNSIIADNKGSSYGAAFYIRQNSLGVLVNCLISGNTSTSGNGGGGVMMYNNNHTVLVNTTITNNTINGPGGGVYRRAGVNTIEIYNSIISGNSSKNDGPDVDVYETDAPAPVIKSSVIGSAVYDINGTEVPETVFNFNSMLQTVGDFAILPAGDDNPAETFGMSAERLIDLGSGLDPVVGEEVIAFDLLHNSRAGLNIMGAFVEGE